MGDDWRLKAVGVKGDLAPVILKMSAAEKAAYEAGLKTAQSLSGHSHKFSLEYSTMAIVQDALRAYRLTVSTKTP